MFRCTALAALLAVPAALFGIDPPAAKKVPVETKLHGDARVDDYAWLKDKKNPEVIKHLDAENAYTAAVMKA